MSGAVMHWQMLSADPERAARFYGDLFGWVFSDANGLGYRTVATRSANGIDGGIWPVPAGSPESVQLYVQVDDIDAVLRDVVALGGTVILGKQVLPDGDAMALATDPLGRSFGLMTRAARAST